MVGKLVAMDWQCAIGVVYGGCTVQEHSTIYNEINDALPIITVPTLFLGDFNQVLSVSERRGQQIETPGIKNFQN